MSVQAFQQLVAGMNTDQKLVIGSKFLDCFYARAAMLVPPLAIDPILGSGPSGDPRWASLVAETCAMVTVGFYQGNQDGVTWGAVGAIFGPLAAPAAPATPAAPGAAPAPVTTAPPSAAPIVAGAANLLASMFAGS